MSKRCFPAILCGLLLLIVIVGFSATALASPSLSWQTETVYYDNQGRIVIEGYFYNNGTYAVTWVNRFDVQVYFRQANTDWWSQAAASFYDLDVALNPGDTLRWTFRIYNVSYAYFDYWNVRWNVNYQYR
ncbi:MAG TPA: hypothetical protein VN521_01135 [Negativicutes bacterium]|nr:hypothetical protein [Negativicutes bacterium]